MLVASHDYLKRSGTPSKPDDLINHNFILYSSIQAKGSIEFADDNKFPYSKVRSNITVNSVNAIRELVKDGLGIHLGPAWVFKVALEKGEICQNRRTKITVIFKSNTEEHRNLSFFKDDDAFKKFNSIRRKQSSTKYRPKKITLYYLKHSPSDNIITASRFRDNDSPFNLVGIANIGDGQFGLKDDPEVKKILHQLRAEV